MNLSGTWKITETWDGAIKDSFTATFNPDGTVTIDGPTAGFAMVWYTGAQPGQQGVILAGDNGEGGILAAYYGTMAPDNASMSGFANGQMGLLPVKGTWQAVQVSSATGSH